VREEAHGGIMLALGALAVRLALSDAYLAYVKPGLKPFLILAGLVLVALGGAVLLDWRQLGESNGEAGGSADGDTGGEADGDTGGHGHVHVHGSSHQHAPAVAWLLVLPVLAIALVAPAPLGAFAADRQPANVFLPPAAPLPPLPAPTAGAVELSLSEFGRRAIYDERQSLDGVPVRLLGFAAPDPQGGGFLLVRFVLSCCAADGRPVRVAIRGTEPPYPKADTWLEVTGTWRPGPAGGESGRPPELVAQQMRPVPPPVRPYEN
jgi:uncharacterized repeat protein (TIGR03943 family)